MTEGDGRRLPPADWLAACANGATLTPVTVTYTRRLHRLLGEISQKCWEGIPEDRRYEIWEEVSHQRCSFLFPSHKYIISFPEAADLCESLSTSLFVCWPHVQHTSTKWPLEMTGRLVKVQTPKYLKVPDLILIPWLLIVFCFLYTFFFGCVELLWLFMHGLIFTLLQSIICLMMRVGVWKGTRAEWHWAGQRGQSQPLAAGVATHLWEEWAVFVTSHKADFCYCTVASEHTFWKVVQGRAFFIFRCITADSKHILQSGKVNIA